MLVTTFFEQMKDCGYLKQDEKLTWKHVFDAATDIGNRTCQMSSDARQMVLVLMNAGYNKLKINPVFGALGDFFEEYDKRKNYELPFDTEEKKDGN